MDRCGNCNNVCEVLLDNIHCLAQEAAKAYVKSERIECAANQYLDKAITAQKVSTKIKMKVLCELCKINQLADNYNMMCDNNNEFAEAFVDACDRCNVNTNDVRFNECNCREEFTNLVCTLKYEIEIEKKAICAMKEANRILKKDECIEQELLENLKKYLECVHN